MRYIIVGAGAVGGAIGGRLYQAGLEVVLVARGAHLEALREHGLRLTTPEGVFQLPVPAVERPEEIELRADDVLVFAVKTQDSAAALDAWADRPVAGGGTAGERLPVMCAQNGVENERLALRRFARVYGVCVWLPATFLEPGSIVAVAGPYTAMLTIGRYPSGADDTAREIAADVEKSVMLAPVVEDVMRWKYSKLLMNLGNAVDAVCGTTSGEEAATLIRRARAEAAAVLDAAGIAYASDAEQKEVRGDKVTVQAIDGVPYAGSSSRQSLLKANGSIEADYLNGEIVLLGRLNGVPTPVNETLCRAANEAARERRAPGIITVAELAARIPT